MAPLGEGTSRITRLTPDQISIFGPQAGSGSNDYYFFDPSITTFNRPSWSQEVVLDPITWVDSVRLIEAGLDEEFVFDVAAGFSSYSPGPFEGVVPPLCASNQCGNAELPFVDAYIGHVLANQDVIDTLTDLYIAGRRQGSNAYDLPRVFIFGESASGEGLTLINYGELFVPFINGEVAEEIREALLDWAGRVPRDSADFQLVCGETHVLDLVVDAGLPGLTGPTGDSAPTKYCNGYHQNNSAAIRSVDEGFLPTGTGFAKICRAQLSYDCDPPVILPSECPLNFDFESVQFPDGSCDEVSPDNVKLKQIAAYYDNDPDHDLGFTLSDWEPESGLYPPLCGTMVGKGAVLCSHGTRSYEWTDAARYDPFIANSRASDIDGYEFYAHASALHPIELQRRFQQGQDAYKEGDATVANAHFRSLRGAVTMALGKQQGRLCGDRVFNPNCYTCPDILDPSLPEEVADLCSLHGRTEELLAQLGEGLNYYGHAPNHVPPAAVTVEELAMELAAEYDALEDALNDWLALGGVDNLNVLLGATRTELDLERSLIAMVELPQAESDVLGVIDLIEGNLAVIDAIDAEVADLQNIQGNIMNEPFGTQDRFTLADVFQVALTAAAAAYGGPLAAGAIQVAFTGNSTDLVVSSVSTVVDDIKYENKTVVTQPNQPRSADALGAAFEETVSEENLKKFGAGAAAGYWELFTKAKDAGPTRMEFEIRRIATNQFELQIRELLLEHFREGVLLGQNLHALGRAQAHVTALRQQLERYDVAIHSIDQDPRDDSGIYPPLALQHALVGAALDNANRTLERASERFFVFRKAVERDLAATGTDGTQRLTQKDIEILQRSVCQAPLGQLSEAVAPDSLRINLANLQCFREWTEELAEVVEDARNVHQYQSFYSPFDGRWLIDGKNAFSISIDSWTSGSACPGNPSEECYRADLEITPELSRFVTDGSPGGARDDHRSKQLYDAVFVLETEEGLVSNDVDIFVGRNSGDTYWVGRDGGQDQYLSFATMRSDASVVPELRLVPLDEDFYRPASACAFVSGDTPPDTTNGGISCRFSNSTVGEPFLSSQSLIGTLSMFIREDQLELANATPVALHLHLDYYHWGNADVTL